LDPAIGTGSFYSALRRVFSTASIDEAVGFEIDPHYGNPAKELWAGSGLRMQLADFTTQQPDPRFNLVICNPPYVRHHHIDKEEKDRLQAATKKASGVAIGGLAGLYCYFMGIANAWMTEGGIAGWLIPSEFMDVNYGRQVKRYLLEQVTLLQIHRFDPDDVQFSDALVSSAVVWFKKAKPPTGHEVLFSYGGSLEAPQESRLVPVSALADETKWTRFPKAKVRERSDAPTVGDFFKIKRGIATGDNKFFILDEEELRARDLPRRYFRPILPSPRHVPTDEVQADHEGLPLLPRRLFLLDPMTAEDDLRTVAPSVWNYLQSGRAKGLHERYLCRSRSLWYAQENRPAAPIVCTYLGRGDLKSGRPFRFVRNRSNATIANVWLAMYPTPRFERALKENPDLLDLAWQLLNKIEPETLLGEGRVYGGGLWKLEPKELANVPLPELAPFLGDDESPKQFELLVA
jgi:hypothetical protein